MEYTDTLWPARWHTINKIVTSGSGHFEFIDDGSLTEGVNAQRFYRLKRVQ